MVVFLEIHPFQDGNGRLSRVLTTLLLLQAGYAYVPYSSLESVVEASKEAKPPLSVRSSAVHAAAFRSCRYALTLEFSAWSLPE
ncbi:hypothetical protein AGMMS50225_14190 [Betaproteobacteria bacterium]|nr:hypothetical protein AGMMS50225_14190 [Betaproteobacteria bacterium]